MRAVQLRYALYGALFGFVLSRMRFSDFGEVHRMFTFHDLRLLLTFAVGVTLIALGFAVIARDSFKPPRPIHRGTVVGSAIFGLGWAVTGACPAIVLVQVGEGQLAALVTLVGVFVGTIIYPRVHARWMRWTPPSCDL